MNLFRSEEHIGRWLGPRDPGATIPVTKLCELAHAWWGNRIDPDATVAAIGDREPRRNVTTDPLHLVAFPTACGRSS